LRPAVPRHPRSRDRDAAGRPAGERVTGVPPEAGGAGGPAAGASDDRTVARRTPPKVPRPHPAPLAESPAIARLAQRAAHDPDAAARFWAELPAAPLIEPAPG